MASSPASGEGAAAVPKNGEEGHGATAERLRYMDKDVAKLLLAAANPRHHPRRGRQTSKPAPAAAAAERARYGCAFEPGSEEEDEGRRLAPPQLVWAKVRTHPWWPAQVVDPADASALARRRRPSGGGVLVAFFPDKSFVWVPDADTASSRLRAFSDGFESFATIAEKRTSFAAALEAALGEVARRVGAGLSCRCSSGIIVSADGSSRRMTRKQHQESQLKHALEENAGIRRGVAATAMDAAFAIDALRGEALVEYVSPLAVAPTAGADGLDLTVATAQLAAFSRWRRSASATAPAMERGRATAARKRRRSAEEDNAEACAAVAAAAGRCNKLTTAAAAAVDALKKRREMLSKEKKLMSRAEQLMSDCELM